MNRILFVTSEAHPLVKTGGLGDVSGSLPPALLRLGMDVRMLMPAYRSVLQNHGPWEPVASLRLPDCDEDVRILEGRLPDTDVPVWLADCPVLYDRGGGPYGDGEGRDWPDNALRFGLLARVAVAVATRGTVGGWRPELVHCNDWQAGLVPPLLRDVPDRPATVFTVHNLAYQGLFSRTDFERLDLPDELWSLPNLEFFGDFSFIKGGLVFADRITTVSPTYAREILTPVYGMGLDGVLQSRRERLSGILNGIDYRAWDPGSDPLITGHFGAADLAGKGQNKAALQDRFALAAEPEVPLAAFIGRLVDQKGVDLLMDALPGLMERPLQMVFLGSGDRTLERRLHAIAARWPHRIGVVIGYDEPLAHLVEAGADLFLMPSRFEPCGLNQMFSQRYGTVPVVHRVGGLADTVVDTSKATVAAGTATGFVFDHPDAASLTTAVRWALACYRYPRVWRQLMVTGMRSDFSWDNSAREYQRLFEGALAERRAP